jgi:hypothetical protein
VPTLEIINFAHVWEIGMLTNLFRLSFDGRQWLASHLDWSYLPKDIGGLQSSVSVRVCRFSGTMMPKIVMFICCHLKPPFLNMSTDFPQGFTALAFCEGTLRMRRNPSQRSGIRFNCSRVHSVSSIINIKRGNFDVPQECSSAGASQPCQ